MGRALQTPQTWGLEGFFRSLQALKPVSKAVLLAETLDIITTFGGLALFPQMWEANPLAGLPGGMLTALALKLFATIVVILVLERVERWPKVVWLIPVVAILPSVWNSLVMLAEVLAAVLT